VAGQSRPVATFHPNPEKQTPPPARWSLLRTLSKGQDADNHPLVPPRPVFSLWTLVGIELTFLSPALRRCSISYTVIVRSTGETLFLLIGLINFVLLRITFMP
jgi:hypothetical protein